GADQRARVLVYAAMNLLDEMLGLEKVGDAVESVVVDQDGAEQRLFGFEVDRRGAVGGFGRIGDGGEPARECFDGRHGFFQRFFFFKDWKRTRHATCRLGRQNTRVGRPAEALCHGSRGETSAMMSRTAACPRNTPAEYFFGARFARGA